MRDAMNFRKYGEPPFKAAVIHGGPGAAGQMAPVAKHLSVKIPVIEPFQSKLSVKEQAEELAQILEKEAAPPVTIIGHSWGAWLSLITAAKYPGIAGKVIIIGSGAFEEKYAAKVQTTRLERLSRPERDEIEFLFDSIGNPIVRDKDKVLTRIGELFSRSDTYKGMEETGAPAVVNAAIFDAVWKDASDMRRRGELLSLCRHIKCPVTAIHGDYDPHPAEGVEKPLKEAIKGFKFILLKNCGHRPWIEKEAASGFFRVLEEEVKS
ncbi:MAG TPA: alpha/beta hydrolase [bacterium]|nr:alpha/beta hydrolase [bacterium]